MAAERLFHTVGRQDKLVDRVVANIQQLIVDGHLEPGMKLPPEREFAERIGVSRTVLREAVSILVTKGLLETRHGVGTVVRQVSSSQLLEPLGLLLRSYDLSVDQLYEVRSILEVGAVRLAALHAEDEEIEALRQAVVAMDASKHELSRFVALDDDFHMAIASAAHNPMVLLLAQSIGPMMHAVRMQVHRRDRIYEMAVPDHRMIVAAVAAHDADAAAEAMQKHLDNARRFQQAVVMESLPAAEGGSLH